MNDGRIFIGTSGWAYPHWRGRFYPQGLGDDDLLGYYADRFVTTEINNTFYRLPSKDTVEAWREAVPDGFLFAVKASRYITHVKRLKEPDRTLSGFLDRIRALGPHLGPVLFQLPGRWRPNPDRFEAFLVALAQEIRPAFEFRDTRWHVGPIFDLLRRHNAAFCIWELEGVQAPAEVTSDLVYVRLHGPGKAYQGSYDDHTLGRWAERLTAWAERGLSVFCYFDNDEAGYAAANAERLAARLRQG